MSVATPQLLGAVSDIARRAGQEILEVYGGAEILTTAKADDSPLTVADLRAHRLIESAIRTPRPQNR